MTEIPEDVIKLAADVCEDVWHAWHDDEGNSVEGDPTAIIARAILAEREAQRERDAKIADNLSNAEHRLEADENIRAHHVRGVYAGNFLSWAHGLKADAAADVAAAIRTPA